MKEKLRELAEQIPDFVRLKNKWSNEHVSRYVRALCDPDNAADTLVHLEKDDLDGVACAYHERVEMDEIERLFERYAARGESFRKLIDSGRLNGDHLWFDMPQGHIPIPYLIAHEVALEKEKEFRTALSA